MRQTICVVVVALIVSLFHYSCKKEDLHNITKFEALKKMATGSERRLAFENFTNIEKADFWRYWISNYMKGTTNAERTLLAEVHDQVTPAVYDKASAAFARFTTLIIPNWLKKAENVFSKDRISEMFFFLEGESIEKHSANRLPEYNESAPDCLCNIGSGYTCRKRKIKVGSNGVEIEVAYNTCTYSFNSYICDRDDYGCGWGGLWACNGNTCS